MISAVLGPASSVTSTERLLKIEQQLARQLLQLAEIVVQPVARPPIDGPIAAALLVIDAHHDALDLAQVSIWSPSPRIDAR